MVSAILQPMVAAAKTPMIPVVSGVLMSEHVPTADQRIIMNGVPWSHFEVWLALRGEAPVPRMTYLQGDLELMSPSRDHERITEYLGLLIATYCIERGIKFTPYGSWTLKKALKNAGVESDQCYIFGPDQTKDGPDLAIEVVWTSGGIDKLEVYRRLGIGEVWLWRNGTIEIYVINGDQYQLREVSASLPGLDVALVCSLLGEETAADAMLALRDVLRR